MENSFWVDTHAHLYGRQFDHDRDAMLQRAFEAGVQRIYLPAIDHETHDDLLALADAYPEHCLPMMGLHPCSVKADYEKELTLVADWLSKRSFVAVGEIGLDLYWDKTFFEQQKDAFVRQMRWAQQLEIPIVIHSRESTEETISILTDNTWFTQGGIFHCFSGTLEQAERIIARGLVLGIGGVVTYKNGGLAEIIPHLPLEKLVLETDAPYLAPVPHRGKRNESAYIPLMAQKIADLQGISVEKVAQVTTATALQVFSRQSRVGAMLG